MNKNNNNFKTKKKHFKALIAVLKINQGVGLLNVLR